jgi:isoleucyl-tRNA synthetase
VDSYCRFLRYEGEEVFQPFGYDAFGLPAENYARSIGGDPKEVTWDNIYKFRRQHLFNWKVNKVVSSFMEFYNKNKNRIISPEKANEVVTLLKIFAPDFSV